MVHDIKIINEQMLNEGFSSYVLGIDLGGTNTTCAVAGVNNSIPFILFSLKFKTNDLNSLLPAIDKTLSYGKNNYNIEVSRACIGAAGVVSQKNDYAKLTNAQIEVKSKEIIQRTHLQSVYIINDFEVIGYGINLLDTNNTSDIFQIKSGKSNFENSKKTKAIIGAGTGLGKCVLFYDESLNLYVPIPSEGGHSDFPVYTNFEMDLVNFIINSRNISQPVTYEEILSGRGLENIYLYLKSTQKFPNNQYSEEIDNSNNKAALISNYRNLDDTCKETFRLFSQFYGRCAKNFVLDNLARGGLYIAGGIAAKNKDIFQTPEFIEEFKNAYQRRDILEEIPIYLIMNYDISLFGSCLAAIIQN